jgi:hypothetical protein
MLLDKSAKKGKGISDMAKKTIERNMVKKTIKKEQAELLETDKELRRLTRKMEEGYDVYNAVRRLAIHRDLVEDSLRHNLGVERVLSRDLSGKLKYGYGEL